jgi:hypothetical protein
MSGVVANLSNRYLRLALKNYERAEQTDSPTLKAKFRKVAGEYRDQALRLMDTGGDLKR